jgi:hypothetical protein
MVPAPSSNIPDAASWIIVPTPDPSAFPPPSSYVRIQKGDCLTREIPRMDVLDTHRRPPPSPVVAVHDYERREIPEPDRIVQVAPPLPGYGYGYAFEFPSPSLPKAAKPNLLLVSISQSSDPVSPQPAARFPEEEVEEVEEVEEGRRRSIHFDWSSSNSRLGDSAASAGIPRGQFWSIQLALGACSAWPLLSA